MNIIRFILLAFLLCTYAHNALAQGCSDAGACTISSLKPYSNDSAEAMSNQFKLGVFYGKADNSITVYGTYVEFSHQLSEAMGLGIKLTTIAQVGNDISVSGLSDVFVNFDYAISEELSFTVAAKLPLQDANGTEGNLPLPMDYQSSLGTIDAIVGIGYNLVGLQIVAAYQQPLTQNENAFFSSSYPDGSPLRAFQSTNNFKRNGDVLLRVSSPLNLSSTFRITPSLLPIYHLGNDRYTNEQGLEVEIIGSKGLTLNANLIFDFKLSTSNALQLNIGAPFIVRDVRPDGLTRSIIANLEYQLRF